jgi:GTP-binding protein YchF
METAIIGLAKSGKTTIFNALTGQSAPVGETGGGKRQAHLAAVAVPDDRLERLSARYSPKKITHATVHFKDLPLEHDSGGGITPEGLSEARKADAITIAVRAFLNESVPPGLKDSTPQRDLRKVMDSLVFSDFEAAEKRVARLEKEAKRDGREYHVLRQIVEKLGSGAPLGSGFFAGDDTKLFSGFGFLTSKPIFAVINTGEAAVPLGELPVLAEELGIDAFPIRGDMEMEIAQLAVDDQADFLRDLGMTEPARNRFLRHVYTRLRLISFFTLGPDECRAWSVPEGTTALGAAGEIHTDMAKGFIRAELAPWEDVLDAGDFEEARKRKKVRVEGKDYAVRDGDCLHIRFNV